MAAVEPQYIDADALSENELQHALWEAGDLTFLMHAGQLALAQDILAWWDLDQIAMTHNDSAIPLLYAVACSKRFGKTSLMLWLWHMLAVQFAQKHKRPLEMRFTSAIQKSIDEIVGKVKPQCFRTAPPSCEAQYHGKRGTRAAGLYMPEYGPTLGASLALAGLDMNPDALRGQSSDGDFVSEGGFITNLEYTVRNVLVHQYQGKPWARMVCESSAPEDLDTDWELVILPDAKARGAHYAATIDDNPMLSHREREMFISMAGGRSAPSCRREYFNEIIGNPDLLCVPEFDGALHVRDVPRPTHAIALGADDPGWRHFYGKCWAYYDFDLQAVVFEDSWARTNASTILSAVVTAAREFDLYGAIPPTKLSIIPLEHDGKLAGWRDLLAGDRCASMADQLYELAQLPAEQRADFETRPGRWVREDRPGQFTYWDQDRHEFMSNPHARVADVDLRLIGDMREMFGFEFSATTKVELRTMVANFRRWIGTGRIIFKPTAGPVIDHTRAAKWDKTRTHLAEHKIYNHFDCVAEGALVQTARGDVPIEDVAEGDFVHTRNGPRRVLASWLVGTREIWRVETESGAVLSATPDHLVWTETRGWQPLSSLTTNDTLLRWESTDHAKLSSGTVGRTGGIQSLLGKGSATITTAAVGAAPYTGRSGRITTGRFQRAWTSIMSMGTRSTTTSRISRLLGTASIAAGTWVRKSLPSFARISSAPSWLLPSGTGQQRDGAGTLSTRLMSMLRPSQAVASFATAVLLPSFSVSGSVACAAPSRRGARREPLLSSGAASSAPQSLAASRTGLPGPVLDAVRRVTAGVGHRSVYDLSVEHDHEFFADGLLVHNCFSAAIYLARYAELIENRNPMPPAGITERGRVHGEYFIDRLPWDDEQPYAAEIRQRVAAAEMELAHKSRAVMKPAARMRR